MGWAIWPWMWVVGPLTMLVFWGGLAVLVVWAVGALRSRPPIPESPDEILRRRLAAGEISVEEYERTRSALGR